MLPKPAIRVSSVVYDDSIWISLTNCLGGELEVVTHPCKKEDHSLFVGGRVGQPGIIYLLPDVVSGFGWQKGRIQLWYVSLVSLVKVVKHVRAYLLPVRYSSFLRVFLCKLEKSRVGNIQYLSSLPLANTLP